MVGSFQHHIPQFFLRGFAVDQSVSKKKKQILVYSKQTSIEALEPQLIKEIAAEDHFYSGPNETPTSPTLDDKITDAESDFADVYRSIRDTKTKVIKPIDAANLIDHFCVRSNFLREALKLAFETLTSDFQKVSPQQFILAMEPSELDKHLDAQIDKNFPSFGKLGLSRQQLKETLRNSLETVPDSKWSELEEDSFKMFELLKQDGPSLIENVQKSILDENMVQSKRVEQLLGYQWVVANSNLGLLPDCLVMALDTQNTWNPYVFVGGPEAKLSAIAMPLSSDSILVGTNPKSETLKIPTLDDISVCSFKSLYSDGRVTLSQSQLSNIGGRTVDFVKNKVTKMVESKIS